MAEVVKEAIELIRRCRTLRDEGKVEAVLRSEFDSRVRRVFTLPGDESWINHYSAGAEAHTKVGKVSGGHADRFIDNLIGSTTIEYEPDLRIKAKFNEGLNQVREHAAGLIRAGYEVLQIRGVLSDTVEWRAYDAVLKEGVDPAACTPTDVTLELVEELDLKVADEPAAQRLISFVRKHLAREKSRPLTAHYLTADLGLESPTHRRAVAEIVKLTNEGRKSDLSIALATDLWSRFVDYLEGDHTGFRAEAYADEFYLALVSRLLSANVLNDGAILSDDAEISSIVKGSYFHDRFHLQNMVELDYFGWFARDEYVDLIVPVARDIQRDLYAYDFRSRPEHDLFGRLMAQLARRAQRQLLGQEWTPAWLAKLLAERCIEGIASEEHPRVIDMCCGSGSMLAEVIRVTKAKRGLTSIDALKDVATGFDIDPLAVSLAKTTWVVTLASEIKLASSVIVIPVYHADSLFAVTPVSASLPLPGKGSAIEISLDDRKVRLPSALVTPAYRELFDRIIDWAYDEALAAKENSSQPAVTADEAGEFVKGAAVASGTALPAALEKLVVPAVHELVTRMAELAVANRNGIWAFILRNTYRPGLLSGQFNGLVSNPPWLALSRLANNPYRELLTSRAKIYDLRPAGSSFLHLELGTTHLIHAVDRYLAPGASVACLVPGTLLAGTQHQPMRQAAFRVSERKVPFYYSEIWQVADGTFKYPSVAIIGRKGSLEKGEDIVGYVAGAGGLAKTDFAIQSVASKRTAWVLGARGASASVASSLGTPQQGADLMPRTAVCVEVLNASGSEYRVETPQKGSKWAFTVSAAKQLKGERFTGSVAPRFLYYIAQSENLLPFVFAQAAAPIALPAERSSSGEWVIYSDADIRRQGFIESARWFQRINAKLATIGNKATLQDRIDLRSKLSKQVFGADGYLVFVGAGGKIVCAACVPVSQMGALVIDQTIYWKWCASEDEAWFAVGMLNSAAMTAAVSPFNPKGDFGERHIHTLAFDFLPQFSAINTTHKRVAELGRRAYVAATTAIEADPQLADPGTALAGRRSKLRNKLGASPVIEELDALCATVLVTTASSAPSPSSTQQ